jgi:prolyl-tRNA editing enzyme YbaK/EbsC (Cys-tRNA(Pro) deacylase)
MTIGGVTPFGLPAPLPVWIDAAVMARDRIVVGGGSRDRKLLLPPSELLKLALAEAVDGLARPAPSDS